MLHSLCNNPVILLNSGQGCPQLSAGTSCCAAGTFFYSISSVTMGPTSTY